MLPTLELPGLWEAIALACTGMAKPVPRVSRFATTGESRTTWIIRENVEPVRRFLAAIESPDPTQNLARQAPEDPYLACLYYLEIHQALLAWLRTGQRPLAVPSAPRSRLLRLVADNSALRPHDLIAASDSLGSLSPLAANPPVAAIGSPLHAAIAILCGFVPAPALDLATGSPRFAFRAVSTTFPGLTLEEIQRAALTIQEALAAKQPFPQLAIGTHPAGEHPVCYAVAAMITLTDFQQAEILAARNPAHTFKARTGPRSAILSEAFLQSSAPPRYRDKLQRHLAGS